MQNNKTFLWYPHLEKDARCHIRQNSVLFFRSLENGIKSAGSAGCDNNNWINITDICGYAIYTIYHLLAENWTEKLSPNRESAFTGSSSLTGV